MRADPHFMPGTPDKVLQYSHRNMKREVNMSIYKAVLKSIRQKNELSSKVASRRIMVAVPPSSGIRTFIVNRARA